MAKIHPQPPFTTSKQETFTIWMKSLILSGKGCTVFDSSGQIIYRVDNYNSNCTNQVYLMDSTGKVLFTIHRKKFKLVKFWEGYRIFNARVKDDDRNPVFQVRKSFSSICEVIIWLDEEQPCQYYQIETCPAGKSSFKISEKLGGLIAEVKRKQSRCGISLGEDVLTMVVEPHIDHSLVMGLVVVYSLINCKM